MSYRQDMVAWQVRRAAVARAIFCPVTGQVLDVRTAVLLGSGDGQRVLAVLSPEGWAQRAGAVRAAMPDAVVTSAKEAGRYPHAPKPVPSRY